MASWEQLLQVKQASINLMRQRGYRQDPDGEKEDDALLSCTDDYLATAGSYFQSGGTIIRNYLIAQNLVSTRFLLSAIYSRKTQNKTEKCVVLFVDTDGKKVLTREIRLIAQILLEKTIRCKFAIIISHEDIGTTAVSSIKMLSTEIPEYDIVHFKDEELMYDPTDHIYSPIKISALTPEEVAIFEDKVGSAKLLPRILVDDPVIKRKGYFAGTVVRLISPVLLPGTLLTSTCHYKIVVTHGSDKKHKKK
jgi:DNA-directed RNA polymerase subunit H (RpoH/RPB5)